MTLCNDWLEIDDLADCLDTSGINDELLADAITAASEWMYGETGSKWNGICTVTERPCHRSCRGYSYCACGGEDTLELRYGPVSGTPTMTVDGAAFGAFQVVPPNLLVRTDGLAWRSCQRYVDTSVGIVVTYSFGELPPQLAVQATKGLAAEIIKACNGGVCSLPAGTVALNRRGVSITLDPEQAGKALPVVALALSRWGRSGRPDIRAAGAKSLVTVWPA